MFDARAVLHIGIVGLLFASQASSSCVTEENHSKGMKETSCVRLALTSVPVTNIPQDTGILILSFNNLKAISTSTFKGMKQLVELDLADNALTSFKVDLPIMLKELILANNSFTSIPDLSQMSSLIKLDLSNNQITTIPDSAFKGLKGLKVLELQRNNIQWLPETIFDELKSLDLLDLSYNQLWDLPTQLISGLKLLGKFYLTENKLTHIPDDFFLGLDVLSYVYLDKNRFNCNCALKYLKEWVEENAHNVYIMDNGTPVNDEKSVLCSDGTPLVDSPKIVCSSKGLGDMDQHILPTKKVKQEKPTTTAKTTQPQMTTMKATTVYFEVTTPEPTTTKRPTTSLATTIALTTPTVPSTTQPETTTTPKVVLTTTTITTTSFKTTTRTTTEQRRTTLQTSEVPTSIIYPSTTLSPTSTLTTMEKAEPSTLLTTSVVSTQKHPITESNVPTSAEVTETSFKPTEVQLYTMPPAHGSSAKAHAMSWLEYKILKNCCFLHLILYILGMFLLLVQILLSAGLLVWTHTHLYRHYRALVEKLPNIRLIRYSLRAPVSEGSILLVHDKAVEAHFSDHSSFGVTKMLVLEANSRTQEQIYTSAIL